MPLLLTDWGTLGLVAVLAYLAGSIPFGILITRALGLGDLRQIGSGNIGATNVLRTGNRGAALATLLLDALKGAIAVLATRWALPGADDAAQLAGLAAFLGHIFPIWLGFRGGKGVATFLGVLLALNLWVGLGTCATWLIVAVLSRFSSLAALVAAASSTFWMFGLDQGRMMVLGAILTVLVMWRHSANIARLKAGTETKIGSKAQAGQ
jgi:acyl phosphate:glycerol-3-phosphate acyltransferase